MGKGSGLELQGTSLLRRQMRSGLGYTWVKNMWGDEPLSGLGLRGAAWWDGWDRGWARSLAHWGHQFVDCGDQSAPPPSPKPHFQAHIQRPWAGLSTPTQPRCTESTDRLHHMSSGDSTSEVWGLGQNVSSSRRCCPSSPALSGSDGHLRSSHLMDEGQTSSSQLAHHVSMIYFS